MDLVQKMKKREKTPLSADLSASLIGFLGGFSVIFILLLLTSITNKLWIMAPFGASCVLAFGVWDSPLSQPKNIIGGHIISASIGLFCKNLFGDTIFVVALAVGLAIMLMMLTKTTHPPAGANPLVILLSKEITGWTYLFTPVVLGSVIVVIGALMINNLYRKRKYPKFWI